MASRTNGCLPPGLLLLLPPRVELQLGGWQDWEEGCPAQGDLRQLGLEPHWGPILSPQDTTWEGARRPP